MGRSWISATPSSLTSPTTASPSTPCQSGLAAVPPFPPTESFALYLTLRLLWTAFSFMVGTWLEHWDVHRLSHKGVVVIFGIIAGVLIRYMGSGMSAVGLME